MKVDPKSGKPIIPIPTLAAICCSNGGKLVKSAALHCIQKNSHHSNTLYYRQVDVRLLNLLCACTGMYVHSAGYIQLNSISPNGVRSVQRNYFKAKVECTLHCHGRDGGAQCTNAEASAEPSGSFNLERNTKTAPLEPSRNEKRRRPNTQGDACERTDPTSAVGGSPKVHGRDCLFRFHTMSVRLEFTRCSP